MLADGALSHGPMSDPDLCSAQGARGGSRVGCSAKGQCAVPSCAAHRVLVEARGLCDLPWTLARFLHVQRTVRSWILVDGVFYNGRMSDPYLCSARDARGCSWMLADARG